MASFGRQRILGRAVALVLLILALIVGGVIWFDFLGLVDIKDALAPVYRALGLGGRAPGSPPAYSPTLLEDERFAKRLESVELRGQELDEAARLLDLKDAEIAQKSQELEERQAALADQEKSFNEKLRQYDNKRANIEQNAQYLVGMPPAQAVEILKAMDDQSVIDILRMVEELAAKSGEDSIVSYWLSKMPAERAAAIQRKMAIKPVETAP